jgi:hypothetical protein
MAQESPKLHIDSDWKAQAQAEKERLSAKEKQAESTAGDRHRLPEPSFQALVSVLASQAIMGLGAYADPKSGRVVIDLEGARFSIDLLGVLEEKTKGNLSEQEASDLRQLLAELRKQTNIPISAGQWDNFFTLSELVKDRAVEFFYIQLR